MTNEEKELIVYCLKANSDFHGEVCEECKNYPKCDHFQADSLMEKLIKALEQEQRFGRCKNCKYFEYDSVAKVGGIPLIVAHEICNKWGDGCKTSEEGFCFLFEPQESEV